MNIINGQEQDIQLVRMCYNCKDCQAKAGANELVCANEANKETAAKKIREKIMGLSEGYKPENISFDLVPVPLKAPERKCPNHTYDIDRILNYLGVISDDAHNVLSNNTAE